MVQRTERIRNKRTDKERIRIKQGNKRQKDKTREAIVNRGIKV